MDKCDCCGDYFLKWESTNTLWCVKCKATRGLDKRTYLEWVLFRKVPDLRVKDWDWRHCVLFSTPHPFLPSRRSSGITADGEVLGCGKEQIPGAGRNFWEQRNGGKDIRQKEKGQRMAGWAEMVGIKRRQEEVWPFLQGKSPRLTDSDMDQRIELWVDFLLLCVSLVFSNSWLSNIEIRGKIQVMLSL